MESLMAIVGIEFISMACPSSLSANVRYRRFDSEDYSGMLNSIDSSRGARSKVLLSSLPRIMTVGYFCSSVELFSGACCLTGPFIDLYMVLVLFFVYAA